MRVAKKFSDRHCEPRSKLTIVKDACNLERGEERPKGATKQSLIIIQ